MYLKYNVRDYFEKCIRLTDKSICDWGCNHGNMINYKQVDFAYTGVDVDLKIIQAMTIKEPYHKWIHFDYYNHQYNNRVTEPIWPKIDNIDAYLLYSVFTHMDVPMIKEHLNYFNADTYATFFSSTNMSVIERVLDYKLDKKYADKIYNKDTAYVVKLKDDVIIYTDLEKLPEMKNAEYFLAFYSPEYMKQFGYVNHLERYYVDGILSTQPCLCISR